MLTFLVRSLTSGTAPSTTSTKTTPANNGGRGRLRAPRRGSGPCPDHVGTLAANAIRHGDVDTTASTGDTLGDLSHHDLGQDGAGSVWW
jgi:hypothetical protein